MFGFVGERRNLIRGVRRIVQELLPAMNLRRDKSVIVECFNDDFKSMEFSAHEAEVLQQLGGLYAPGFYSLGVDEESGEKYMVVEIVRICWTNQLLKSLFQLSGA